MKQLFFAWFVFFCCSSHACHAQLDKMSELMLTHLVDINNKAVQKPDSAVFMIATDKWCGKCFTEACDLYKGRGLPVFLICLMPKDLTLMISNYGRYLHVANCIKDVYFLWTDKLDDAHLRQAASEPSPQLIIVTQGKATYIDYAGFFKMSR